MKILFLLAQYAPLNVAGAYRPTKFIKYLVKNGHHPIVITLPPHQAAQIFKKPLNSTEREDLLQQVPTFEIPVSNLDDYNPRFIKDFFRVVDKLGELWWVNLKKELPAIIQTEKPDLLLTSAPPFSLGPLAKKIAQSFNLPWVLDLRDAWSQWCVAPYRSYWHYQKLLSIEKDCIKHADLAIATTPQTAAALNKIHHLDNQSSVQVVSNGYESDIKWPEHITIKNEDLKDEIVVGYVGSFYYSPQARDNMLKPWHKKPWYKVFQYVPHKEDWLYRSPFFFFKILKAVFESFPELKPKIRLEFVGEEPQWLKEMITDFGLEQNYKSYGFVSHDQSLEIQKRFDFFLCTSAKILGGEDYSMGSKYYEYIQYKKPLLGFTPTGVLKNFIQNCRMGFVFDPDDLNKSEKQLAMIFREDIELKIQPQFLDSYHLQNQHTRFIKLISEKVIN